MQLVFVTLCGGDGAATSLLVLKTTQSPAPPQAHDEITLSYDTGDEVYTVGHTNWIFEHASEPNAADDNDESVGFAHVYCFPKNTAAINRLTQHLAPLDDEEPSEPTTMPFDEMWQTVITRAAVHNASLHRALNAAVASNDDGTLRLHFDSFIPRDVVAEHMKSVSAAVADVLGRTCAIRLAVADEEDEAPEWTEESLAQMWRLTIEHIDKGSPTLAATLAGSTAKVDGDALRLTVLSEERKEIAMRQADTIYAAIVHVVGRPLYLVVDVSEEENTPDDDDEDRVGDA